MFSRRETIQARAKWRLADSAPGEELDHLGQSRARAPLRIDLHDAVVLARRGDHPRPFDHIVRGRLFDQHHACPRHRRGA